MTPELEFSFRIEIQVDKPHVVSCDKVYGKRQLIPIASGVVSGEITGEVLPGGIDSQVIDSDGLCHLSARYAIKTHNGASFYIENNGIRRIPEQWRDQLFAEDMRFFNEIPAQDIYFKTVPTFEVYDDSLKWLTESVFICTAQRTASGVFLDMYRVK
ncbi:MULTISPECIES: DUF3237 family protein [Vibrio]|uniref:UPF0311 protein F9817_09055 n=2 Tax=Vibrio TaxID=662 RepID=A0A7X4LK03_9VIBR|nr:MULTISPECIES: DUF3237 family protein [Vibrio]MBF9002580.1 DUF3237 family protein [Vibrio nitrifigilis]MZI93344.1 DUF3237 family protein [Vibrio eleionomae]